MKVVHAKSACKRLPNRFEVVLQIARLHDFLPCLASQHLLLILPEGMYVQEDLGVYLVFVGAELQHLLVHRLEHLPALMLIPRCSFGIFACQGGACQQTSAQHDAMQMRVGMYEPVDVVGCAEVAVVDEWMLAEVLEEGKLLHVHISLIHLLADAWMQGEMLERRLVEDGQYGLPLVVALESQSHLHGETDAGTLFHFAAEHLDTVGVGQNATAAHPFCLHGCRASHVDVYLLVAMPFHYVA